MVFFMLPKLGRSGHEPRQFSFLAVVAITPLAARKRM
jgi:hypothetical protein